jgi:Tol biopolymer transport system component/class 3 adenylate cyclase
MEENAGRGPDRANIGDYLPGNGPSTAHVQGLLGAEIAHVLYFDIVGWSLLKTDQGSELVQDVFRIIRETSEFKRVQREGKLVLLPSGDGSAIVFFRDPAEPARCALEISQAIQARPDIQIRMGINTGPCQWITDINGHAVVAGTAINFAQRAMDCGDAGHILLTQNSANYLMEFTYWAECIEDLGEFQIKHGRTIHLFNLRKGALGNPAPLTRTKEIAPPVHRGPTQPAPAAKRKSRFRLSFNLSPLKRLLGHSWVWAIATVILLALAALILWNINRNKPITISSTPIKLDVTDPIAFPSLSPDGSKLAYSRRVSRHWNVYLAHFKDQNQENHEIEGSPVNISGDIPGDYIEPAFSPSGNEVAFVHETGPTVGLNGEVANPSSTPNSEIVIYYVQSGTRDTIPVRGYNPSWSEDGKTLALATENVVAPEDRATLDSTIILVDVATRSQSGIPNLTGDAVQPSWSPNRKRIAFWFITKDGKRDLASVNVNDGRDRRPITSDGAMNWDPVWSADGYLYFCSKRGGTASKIWRVRIDESSGRSGSPQLVQGAPDGSAQISLMARPGKTALIAFMKRDVSSSIHGQPLDSRGNVVNQPGWTIIGDSRSTVLGRPEPSPDGKLVVYNSTSGKIDSIVTDDPSGAPPIEVVHSDGLDNRPPWWRWVLGKGPSWSLDRGPRWSPDGKQIAFFSNRNGKEWEVWSVSSDNSNPVQLTNCEGQDCFGNLYPVWSPFGNRIAYTRRGSKTTDMQTLISDVGPDSKGSPGIAIPRVPNYPDEGFTAWSWSGNGHALAGYTLHSDGSLGGIYSITSQNGTFKDGQYHALAKFGMDPVWMKDDRHLLFLNKGAIYILDASVSDPASTIHVIYAPTNFDVAKRGFGLTRDDSEIVFASEKQTTKLYVGAPKP